MADRCATCPDREHVVKGIAIGAKARAATLRKLIRHHDYLYHALGRPGISDSVRHTAPMLSLRSTRFDADVRLFFGSADAAHGVRAEPKLDGLSLELVYERGRLARGVTRGDGERGDVVTENAGHVRVS